MKPTPLMEQAAKIPRNVSLVPLSELSAFEVVTQEVSPALLAHLRAATANPEATS